MGDEDHLTYSEQLRVVWILTWRGSAIGFSIGFVIGVLVGFVAAAMGRSDLTPTVVSIFGFLGALFIGSPLVIRMMFRKEFDGFSLKIVRPSSLASSPLID
jgi:hypothetical protein